MRILVAEDNPAHRRLLEALLSRLPGIREVVVVNAGGQFLDRMHHQSFDLALLDYHLPDLAADEVLERLDQLPACPPVIVISADGDSETVISALRSGGRDFLPKSQAFDQATLAQRVTAVLERKRAQERLINQQKDECLSVLAGGIAHDFNNMLAGIIGNASLLGRRLEDRPNEQHYAHRILDTAQRLADLARQLVAYARGGKYQPRPVCPNNAVHDTIAMLSGAVSPRIALITDLADDLWTVEADFTQLVQAILNLALNACQAMGDRGRLVIRTDNVHRNETWTSELGEHPRGDCVRVTLTDSGPGITPDLRPRLFEPYFSTKGDGRGLGLAAVRGIVENHHGAIAVDSEAKLGSTFEIFLPRLRSAPLTRDHRTTNVLPAAPRKGTVLVIDDEPEIREIVSEILNAEGYRVRHAATGTAVRSELHSEAQFDTVILDMRLPDCSGAELYAEITQRLPHAQVIICSGYEREAAMSPLLLAKDLRFLPKPFTPTELLRVIETPAPGTDAAAPDAARRNGST